MRKLLFLITIVVFVLFTNCSKESNNLVKYEVSCSPGGFDITYQNSSGNTEQKSILSTNWSTSFSGNSGDFVYISAQADNENATVTARIYYEGELIETATSSGDYVIATASGSLP
jgi:hypothetical protein